MHFDAGPWARLMRELPLAKLFLLGIVSLGLAVAALKLASGPLPFIRPVLPLFAVAGGIGVAALLTWVFRLVWAAGRTVRIVAAVLLGVALLGGSVVWYSLNVARRQVRRACGDAATASSQEQRAAALAAGRAGISSFFFRVAQIVKPDASVEDLCAYGDTDEVRRARGLCPRIIEGDAPCRCGWDTYPNDLVRNARCKPITCDGHRGYVQLTCDTAPSSPSSGPY